jgi:nucleotide-binding universal stress UspA family protein
MPDISESDPRLHMAVGYDGSEPARRALDAAVRLLRGRSGDIEVIYVASISGLDALSVDAVAEMEADFDEIAKDLRASAAEQLTGHDISWEFQRRQGPVTHELLEEIAAIDHAHPGDTTVVVVGSSSSASHRLIGSVAVGLARHCPVPLMIVP